MCLAVRRVPMSYVCFVFQPQFIELCKTLYNMFSDQHQEQQLYHSIATVATLLLQIGEVGKSFSSQKNSRSSSVMPPGGDDCRNVGAKQQVVVTTECGDGGCEVVDSAAGGEDVAGTGEVGKDSWSGGVEKGKEGEDGTIGESDRTAVTSEDENNTREIKEQNDESTRSDSGSSTSKEQDPESQPGTAIETNGAEGLVTMETCSTLADGVSTTRDESRPASTRCSSVSSTSLVDLDWSITFEQFLATVLTEPPLVKYFEEQIDINGAIEYYRNRSQLL